MWFHELFDGELLVLPPNKYLNATLKTSKDLEDLEMVAPPRVYQKYYLLEYISRCCDISILKNLELFSV